MVSDKIMSKKDKSCQSLKNDFQIRNILNKLKSETKSIVQSSVFIIRALDS
jgi:hypothetical protein